MPCTAKKTLELAQTQGNEVIIQVKANQPTLLAAVQHVAEHTEPLDEARQFDHARNRIEQRHLKVFQATPVVAGRATPDDWALPIAAVIRVHRQTECFQTRTGTWKPRTETAYYVATHLHAATVFVRLIRGHWGIENRNHYVRDVTLGEDRCRIRCNPGIFARLRSFALNSLRKNQVTNVSEALYDNALCLNKLLGYVGLI